ncbi:cell division protein FtsQ/DivIB [Alkalilimnicola sp. S0819]|uniref:cell division protein FtsQ/DivIB n=1 Tax=Alkalilimnicola sp. S0819 TaxID=2613922 RepID=UPI00186AA63A|nr:cell division protein FtsQ/DivIB [Alkalilimnicola sp. S0819]
MTRAERQPSEAGPLLLSRLRWVLAGALLVLVLIGGRGAWHWLGSDELFPLRGVSLQGELRHVDEAALREAMSVHLGRGMLGLDMDAIRRAVEALPWVERAAARRLWPGTLLLEVREQQALGRWGEAALVSVEGELFRPEAASVPEGLPALHGPDVEAARVASRYLALRERFDQVGLALTGLSLDARDSWRLTLADGARLELGSEETERRVSRFLRVWPRLDSGERGLARVDLRYPHGFAVAWAEPGPDKRVGGSE